MLAIQKVLIPQARLEIFRCAAHSSGDIKGWIANQNYFVDSPLVAGDFSIRAGTESSLINALANDCNRMSIAAIESICGVREDPLLKRSGAWGVVRSYYAAFYAIHAILRMFGISCSQLDQVHVDKIFENAQLYGNDGGLKRIEKGFYSIEIDKQFEIIRFKKYSDSHKDTWGRFLLLLNRLIDDSNDVPALSVYKQEVIDVLMRIKKDITRSRCSDKGNWLSVIRNSINYQHSHGVWFPYEVKTNATTYINSMADDWKKSVDDIYALNGRSKGDIAAFFEISLIINSLFRELIISCVKKTDSVNKIFLNGSLKLLKIIKAVE